MPLGVINITCGTEACHFSGIVDLLQKLEWKFVLFHEVEIVFHAQVFGGVVFNRVRFYRENIFEGISCIDTTDIYQCIHRYQRYLLFYSETPQMYTFTFRDTTDIYIYPPLYSSFLVSESRRQRGLPVGP